MSAILFQRMSKEEKIKHLTNLIRTLNESAKELTDILPHIAIDDRTMYNACEDKYMTPAEAVFIAIVDLNAIISDQKIRWAQQR